MTNYRIYNAKEFVAGASGSLSNAWGVMRASAICSGSVVLEGFVTASNVFPDSPNSTIKLEHLAVGEPIPCYVKSITVTAGSAYLLS
jgi:hypothetical protein